MQSLLLHVCCGPCATQVIRVLSQEYSVTGFFYNPNIFPEEEYQRRVASFRRLAEQFHLPYQIGNYDYTRWEEAVQGYTTEPEGKTRCSICYRFRLERTAQQAIKTGFSLFTTTLTISPHKSARVINPIGLDLAQQYHISFYQADFKKKDGFKQSCSLAKEYNLYRQTYCGCKYSLRK
ncbi:MAG: epoxyqueuosine reductase QueH [bacterium]|nr:epoxyqueuosine reductase QueH [bacterium]